MSFASRHLASADADRAGKGIGADECHYLDWLVHDVNMVFVKHVHYDEVHSIAPRVFSPQILRCQIGPAPPEAHICDSAQLHLRRHL